MWRCDPALSLKLHSAQTSDRDTVHPITIDFFNCTCRCLGVDPISFSSHILTATETKVAFSSTACEGDCYSVGFHMPRYVLFVSVNVCVYVSVWVYMCVWGSNDVEKPQSEAPNGVWNGQSSDGSLHRMTNGVPAMCSRYPDTYTGVKCWPLILSPPDQLTLMSPQTSNKDGAGWRKCAKKTLKTMKLIVSYNHISSASLPEQEYEKEAGLFNTRDPLWNISEMMSAVFGFIWHAHGNWNLLSLCLFVQCVRMQLSIAWPRISQVPPGGDCGWLITNAVVSQGGGA